MKLITLVGDVLEKRRISNDGFDGEKDDGLSAGEAA